MSRNLHNFINIMIFSGCSRDQIQGNGGSGPLFVAVFRPYCISVQRYWYLFLLIASLDEKKGGF
jgi:hypothetical protein